MALRPPPTTVQAPIYLTANQIGASALLGGWSQADLPTVIAVCLAESAGQVNAIGSLVGGARAYGLMQVMWPTHQQLFSGGIESGHWMDGPTNMQMARSVYGSQGWKAWEAYTNGRYRLFTGQAAAATASLNGQIANAGGQATNVATSVLEPARARVAAAQQQWAAANGSSAAPAAAGVLTTQASNPGQVVPVADGPTTTGSLTATVRLLEVVLGVALVLGGAYMFSRPVTDPLIALVAKLSKGDTARTGTGEEKPKPAAAPAKKKTPAKKKPAAAPAEES